MILIRHGESLWNEKNLFTGCCDVPLTQRGVEEAIEAGKRISYIPVDMIFTSALIRAQMTAMLAMTQHLQKKVVTPIMPVNTGILYACKIFLTPSLLYRFLLSSIMRVKRQQPGLEFTAKKPPSNLFQLLLLGS